MKYLIWFLFYFSGFLVKTALKPFNLGTYLIAAVLLITSMFLFDKYFERRKG